MRFCDTAVYPQFRSFPTPHCRKFGANPEHRIVARIMALDAVNARMGRGKVGFGLVAEEAPWAMQCDNRTPSYTTSWEDLPVART
jgi:hypothetical protein